MTRLSVMLLSECREMFGIVMMPLDKWKELQAAIAEHEAAPERKCGTCKFYDRHAPMCLNNDNDVGHVYSQDWFCADWQRKEGT